MTDQATAPFRVPLIPYDPNNVTIKSFAPDLPYSEIAKVITVMRCTEAIDDRNRITNMGDPNGRLIEIATMYRPHQVLLMDRRLARHVAAQILELAGPEEELPTDLLYEGLPFIVYEGSNPVGFRNADPETQSQEIDVSQ